MARGLVTITSVSNIGVNLYRLILSDSTNIANGDTIGARLGTGAGAIYRVNSALDGIVDVTDDLLEAEPSAFGQPATGSGAFGTPETNFGLHQLPFNAPGWDAALRRNSYIADQNLGGGGTGGGADGATGATGVTGTAGSDGSDGATGATGTTGAGALQSLADVLSIGNTTSDGTTGGNIILSSGDSISGSASSLDVNIALDTTATEVVAAINELKDQVPFLAQVFS